MDKRAFLVLGMIVIASVVLADLNIEEHFDSGGGDINIATHPNSGEGQTNYRLGGDENTNYYIDGDKAISARIDRELSDAKNKIGNGMDYIYSQLLHTITVEPRKLDRKVQHLLRAAFEDKFVSRDKYEKDIMYLITEINMNRMEIMALYEVVDPSTARTYDTTISCDARLKVAKRLNMTSVTCGNTTYYNHLEGDKFYGLKKLE